MSVSPIELARRVSAELGLDFAGAEGRDDDGRRWFELHPVGHHRSSTFTIRTTLGWRRLDVTFFPGTFASDLVGAMGAADETGRAGFVAVLEKCRDEGAEVEMTVNGGRVSPQDPSIWGTQWRAVGLTVRRGMLPLNEGDESRDFRIVEQWTSRAAAAVLALIPLETDDDEAAREADGLPEGGKERIEVNRYERDRRNRAAALAIHGHGCAACGLQLDTLYGASAAGLIEVHHVVPVSAIGAGYVINPSKDLVPLCPNCHRVAHRRAPPFSVAELKEMLTPASASQQNTLPR